MVPIENLIEQCAPTVSPVLMQALVHTESAGRPFAIGMDSSNGVVKQPGSAQEAVASAKQLVAAGRKFSVGLAQIHVSNVKLYRMTWEQAFDPCHNLAVGQKILWNFFHRASASGYSGVAAIWAALRGYNSGGVDRTISDDYASRIFAYMSSAPPQLQIGRGRSGAHVPANGPQRPLITVTSPVQAPEPQRAGESLDIFEKAKAAGF